LVQSAIILDVQDLHKTYHGSGEPVQALRGVDLSINAGTFASIMGASGSGKSTFLHLIGGLEPPDRGKLLVENQEIARLSDHQRTLFRRRRLGIVFQQYNLLPMLTARENVALPLIVDGKRNAQIWERVDETISLVRLSHRADHRPNALSGGEQQRVAIARALLNDPALILADEPTGNLDSNAGTEICELLARLSRELGKTVIMVTHSADAAAISDVVHVIKDGVFVGRIEPKGGGDGSLVAAEYQKLAH
jgi:putative ABC transport system ATP-binding protein